MKKIFFILLVLVVSGCYWSDDYNDYNPQKSRQETYLWLCNHELFESSDSVQIIGHLDSKYSSSVHHINRRLKVYHDTIYVERRNDYSYYNIFNGVIMVNDSEHIMKDVHLQ